MLRNRKLFWWSGGSLALLVACTTLLAAPGADGLGGFGRSHSAPGPIRRMMMGHLGRMMVLRSDLNVTAEQRVKLIGIAKDHHSEIQPAVKNLSLAARNLRDRTISDNPQESEIRSAANELGKVIGDAAVLASKGIREAKTVMTPDQLALVKRFLADDDRARDNFLEELKKLPEFSLPR